MFFQKAKDKLKGKPDGSYVYRDASGKETSGWMPPELLSQILRESGSQKLTRVFIRDPDDTIREDLWPIDDETAKKLADHDGTVYVMSHLEDGNPKYSFISKRVWDNLDGMLSVMMDPSLSDAQKHIPQDNLRIGLLGDGADWLWKHMTACFPKGRQILDYFHCAEHIHQVARLQYGEGSQKCLEWVESTLTRLFYAEVDNVIWGLQRMKPNDELAKEEIRKLIGYLDNNRQRIHYRGDRIGGYPIGSGGIESANKFISHTRMKRSGAWWVKETGNEMLAIRCAIYNGTYDQVFDKYKKDQMSP